MTRENQIFVVDLVVSNSPWKIVAKSVINKPTSENVKPKTIAKIEKYKKFCEGHHFITMALEVHNAIGHDMDCFIKECACLFHDKWSRGHLFLFFCIQFFKQHVNMAFQRALAFTIERKIALAGNVCSKPPIISRFHNLHASKIKKVVGR